MHQERLAESGSLADELIWHQPPGLGWSQDMVVAASATPARVAEPVEANVTMLQAEQATCHVVVMSNRGFGGIHRKLMVGLGGD